MRRYATIRRWMTILIMCLISLTGAVCNAAQQDSGIDSTILEDDNSSVPDGVHETVSTAVARQEQEIRARFRQAVIMLHAGEYDYAVAAMRRVLELSPKMPEAHVNMGFALLGQGHPGVARDFFLGAIELRPGQANAYWGLAVSLEKLCDIKGATGAMRTYLHLADADSRYVSKARAAIWEWESAAGKEHIEPGGGEAESELEHRSGCAGTTG